MTPDPLDLLLREAAGRGADPAPSRRASRAALGLALGWRRRRDARTRVVRTLAIAAALVILPDGQLGSDDFGITVTSMDRSGRERTFYRQGLRGEEVGVNRNWAASGRTEQDIYELFQQTAAGQGVPVGVQGFQLGPERDFTVTREYKLNGRFLTETRHVPSLSTATTAGIKAFILEDHLANYLRLLEISDCRAPDLAFPLYSEGLTWIVDGWRITLPGRGEVIYYEGLRADGVRSQDGLPY